MFSYQPADDPFEEDEGAIWSLHYFFFSKALKRVCYIYLRGIPVISHRRPTLRIASSSQRAATADLSASAKRRALGLEGLGANKRAKFWLGDRTGERITASDDEADDEVEPDWSFGSDGGFRPIYDGDDDDIDFDLDEFDDYDDDDDDESLSEHGRGKSPIRGVSEDIASRMEIET